MKIIIVIGVITAIIASFFAGWYLKDYKESGREIKIVKNIIPDKPLEKYAIENLGSDTIKPGTFTMLDKISEHENFDSYKFEFEFNPGITTNETKKTTGMINIPKLDGKLPLVYMMRGYVDPTLYETGVGSKNGSYFFADNGFITVAPDFLGYADSDIESSNIFESRFQTYVTAISLLKSLNQIDEWDRTNLFMWGHSNGGQIAIVILETQKTIIPTTLWAPMTKPFPYSILYFTDESVDRGKFLRKKLAEFENFYDVEKYSLDNYFDMIQSPLIIHQGISDDAVSYEWTREFVSKLKELEKEYKYHEYLGTDHNMRPSWDEAISKDLEFFKSKINSYE